MNSDTQLLCFPNLLGSARIDANLKDFRGKAFNPRLSLGQIAAYISADIDHALRIGELPQGRYHAQALERRLEVMIEDSELNPLHPASLGYATRPIVAPVRRAYTIAGYGLLRELENICYRYNRERFIPESRCVDAHFSPVVRLSVGFYQRCIAELSQLPQRPSSAGKPGGE